MALQAAKTNEPYTVSRTLVKDQIKNIFFKLSDECKAKKSSSGTTFSSGTIDQCFQKLANDMKD